MRIHITNLYGVGGIGAKAQNAVVDIASRELQFNELGIYFYPVNSDSAEMLRTRLDGILAAVSCGDIVIIQSPTWNDLKFDENLMSRLNNYMGLKKIIFLHDVPPLMYEVNRSLLGRCIKLYNQADLIIAPSQNMVDYLRTEGLTVEKTVLQKMWDFHVSIDYTIKPQFKKVINFAGNPNTEPKLLFARNWKYNTIQLAVTVNDGEWAKGRNVRFLGWFSDDNLLANALRSSGGFGLLWSEDPYWREYMKLNASYKISAYLAAGIPVIVHTSIPEKDTIIRKNLGLVVNSLDEAVDRIEHMGEEEYKKMVKDVELFSSLLRNGFFVKKVLTDAVYKLLAD